MLSPLCVPGLQEQVTNALRMRSLIAKVVGTFSSRGVGSFAAAAASPASEGYEDAPWRQRSPRREYGRTAGNVWVGMETILEDRVFTTYILRNIMDHVPKDTKVHWEFMHAVVMERFSHWVKKQLWKRGPLDVDELGELCAVECPWLQVTDGSTFLGLLGYADAAGRYVVGRDEKEAVRDHQRYAPQVGSRRARRGALVGACLRQVL